MPLEGDLSQLFLPLRVALQGPWPPATAEQAWQELLRVVSEAVPASEAPPPRTVNKPQPTRATPPRAKSAATPTKLDPRVEAVKEQLHQAMDRLAQAAQAAEQVQAGWYTRTSEKFKKYSSARDLKHRKAFLEASLLRSATSLERVRSRHQELKNQLDQLTSAIAAFEALEKECSRLMQQNHDENVGLWRELKAAQPLLLVARQTLDKTRSKNLTALEDSLKRAETTTADWTARHQAITEPAQVSLSWLTTGSKLGQRLQTHWQQIRVQTPEGWDWPDDHDPFEGACVCKDKLADHYKVGGSHKQEKPIEIDLAAETDLLLIGLEARRQSARALCQDPAATGQ